MVAPCERPRYWDTEIKRAQETRPRRLPGVLTPQGDLTDLRLHRLRAKTAELAATHLPCNSPPHNALTRRDRPRTPQAAQGGFEFQRLHGMGESLYQRLGEDHPYAVRGGPTRRSAAIRESSWPSAGTAPAGKLAPIHPSVAVCPPTIPVPARNAARAPADIVGTSRRQRGGIPDIRPAARDPLSRRIASIRARHSNLASRVALNGLVAGRCGKPSRALATSVDADARRPQAMAVIAVRSGFRSWSSTAADARASDPPGTAAGGNLARAADGAFHRALANARGGKTLGRLASEVRRGDRLPAANYAAEGRKLFGDGTTHAGAETGESNVLRLRRPRRSSIAIVTVEFPARRFSSDKSPRRLMAGNTVVAKTRRNKRPWLAAEAVRLLHEAGVPESALHLVPGDGSIGAALGRRIAEYRRRRSSPARTDVAALDQPSRWRPRRRPDRAADRGDRRHQTP